MKKAVITLLGTVTVIAGVVLWMYHSGPVNVEEILMIAGVLIIVVFAVAISVQRMKSVREKLPPEDEFSKQIMRKSASLSYYISLYLWLLIMYFESKLDMDRSSVIGMGILGMALVFAGCWVYYRYFRKSSHE